MGSTHSKICDLRDAPARQPLKSKTRFWPMEVVYERCCGLDVHKETVVACVVVPGAGEQPHKETRTFNTMTADLLELADWLTAQGVTHVALESTGVYWKAPWNV